MMDMSAKSRKAIQAQAENLSKKVEHFTKAEIECLIQHFNSLLADQVSRGKAAHGLDRGTFRGILQNVFGLTNAMMMDGDCFQVYDLNDDKYISKEEIFHMLKQSFIKQPTEEDPDEGLKEVVEITMKTMDHDHDGLLSFEDFQKSVQGENLLLEAFGTCLPDPMHIKKFEQLVFQEQHEQ